ncbi:unnamed protein product [Kuraishia capsulata CBS 1993]|uniref:C2H2-type domain-containing protein n=1 Tax=Kuraishia capsulata CBS 1993 TaxID=1382522 RepID=W6MLV2_9ASCO|nr:uncharacterized protein KUCA_T00003105001 [Kuraishia capsulata CBS 1993]CDK27128.1 unnamed protein product [Kuraishia capsulata CBS 1993]
MSTSTRRRKRGTGPFECTFEGCGKIFSRSDHMARHSLNHSVDNRFQCEWPGCTRLFTRHDVMKKHQSRHADRENRPKKANTVTPSTTSTASQTPERLTTSFSLQEIPTTKGETKKISPSSLKVQFITPEVYSQASNGALAMMQNASHNIDNSSLDTLLQSSNPPETDPKGLNTTPVANESAGDPSLGVELPASTPLSPSHLIKWLMRDPANLSPDSSGNSAHPENGAFHDYYDGHLGSSTISMLKEIFAITPEFPTANYQSDVDETLIVSMLGYIPSLQNHPDFEIPKIKYFLELYWLMYHSQYPILHRPSFSTFQVHPLLLLSMVMIGASFSKSSNSSDNFNLVAPDELADMIADPLRWLIFSCEEAKPACKSWVIQSLLILETYEITKTSRTLHERACIYNGAKIQLLRRSPILGGDPSKDVSSDPSHSNTLWRTWIESESMKRVAWMSFYVDTMNAVVYGHPVNVHAYQINLSLPCPDEFWDYDNVDRNEAPNSVVQMPLFSEALKRLLQKETVQTGIFGRKILLAGLLNLTLQAREKDSQLSILGWDSVKERWTETIGAALDNWRTQLPEGSCCITSSCVYHSDVNPSTIPGSLQPRDLRCKFPEFHAAQIFQKVTHYDYIVYAGAPKRMNVPILPEDYEIVARRVTKWANSLAGRLCVVNSYILLCEMMISPEGAAEPVNFVYEPNKDPFIYRPNVVISAVLSLWVYSFHLYGPESFFYSSKSNFRVDGEYVPAMEDACTYLRRIRNEFAQLTGKSLGSLHTMNSVSYGQTIKEFAEALPSIKNVNNLVGLLSILSRSYIRCRWETGREYGKLLGTCVRKSMGSDDTLCVDMYEN